MSTPPPHPDQRNNGLTNSYDPASTIRFEEPRRLPIGLIAAVLGGFLLACGIIFVVMYKVNVGPAPAPRPQNTNLGTPQPEPSANKATTAEPAPKKAIPTGDAIPGTERDTNGEIVVTNPSRCTFLTVHLESLAQMSRENPGPDMQKWIAGKQAETRERLARFGC